MNVFAFTLQPDMSKIVQLAITVVLFFVPFSQEIVIRVKLKYFSGKDQ